MKQNTHTNFIAYFAMKTFALFLILLTSSFLRAQDATLRMDMEWLSSTANTADFQVRITNLGTVPFTFNSVIVRGTHAASLTTGTVSWIALNNNTIPGWLGWPQTGTTNFPYNATTRKLNFSSNVAIFTSATAPTIPIPAGTGVIIGTFRVSTTTTWVPNSNFSFVWDPSAAVVGYMGTATTVSTLQQSGLSGPNTCGSCLTVTAPAAQVLNPQAVAPPSSSVLTGTATICSGSSTNLSVAVTGGVSPYTVIVTDGTTNFSATSASPVSISVSPTTTSTYSIVSVTGAVPGAGTGNTGSATVTVNQAPAATISYSGSPWCSSSAVQSVSQTGTTGGTYSSTAGLTINVSTGAITPGTSTAGTYTVTYTIAAVSPCAALSVTTSVTITAAQSATIAYASSTICGSSTTVQAVTQTGTTGGTYSSSPSGLSISTAGAITPNTSIEGAYTVTYTLASAGVCPSVSASTTITISSALTTPTITYAGSPFCKSLTSPQVVTQTGSTGGVYTSSPAGLSINASTGAITPSISTATTTVVNYTVTYTVTASGCTSVSATTIVPIGPIPSGTISYAGSPYCKTSTTAPSVTRSTVPSSTGTYSISPTGWTINTTNGGLQVPNLSTAGVYTVTLTLSNALTGGCGSTTFTTPVTILATPTQPAISYTGSPFCKTNTTAQSVTQTGTTGGTYTSTTGLSISSSTGAITPSTSTAGTYTVTYTTPSATGCTALTATASVTITATPIQPVISYAGSPFCKTLTTAQSVTRTGAIGGTYSSTTGLIISATTGAITPSTSTAGTYTVTYTVSASGGCAAPIPAITTVSITTTPTVTIAYTGTPFCSSAAPVSVTQTLGAGAYTGGTYTVSPVGLTINSSSGQITPSSSTAGAYTVTYTIPAGNGCAIFLKTTSVTITALPAATISYAGSPFCKTLTSAQSVTRIGTSGGTYSSSPAGMSINVSSGSITPSTSTAGPYTVTYSIAAAGGCSAVSTTTNVIITTPPNAPTISYSGSPWCASSTAVQSVTQTGTTGGTYSSTTGLSINSSTGVITPSTSTAGTYTVTYTTPSAGCTPLSTTTTVIISETPAQPTLACYQTAVLNTTTCVWDVIGTQASNPTTISASVSYTWANNGQTYSSSGTYFGNDVNCVAQVLILTINSATIRMDMEWLSSTTNTADFQVRITNTGIVPFTFNSVIVRGVHAASLTTGTVSWIALNNNTIPEWLGWPQTGTTNLPYNAPTRKLNFSSGTGIFTSATAPTIPIPAGAGVIIGTFRVSTTTTWVTNSDFGFEWDGTGAVIGYIGTSSTVSSLQQTGVSGNGTCGSCLTVTASIAQPLNPPTPTASILSGNATICSGSSTNLSVAVTGGTSPYTVTVTDGTNNYSATGASPLSIPVSPTSTSTYSIVSVIGGGTGTGNTGSATVTVNSCSSNSTLNITMFIQGYYAGNNTMTPVLANQAEGTSTTIVDTILVQLINPTSLLVVASAQGVLQTNGTAACTFSTAQSGSFYIAVKHRNTIETWSTNPIAIGASSSYNFTTSANKAYGDNMIEMEPGVWSFYSGDINQDGFIEASDFPLLNNDNDAFAEGYLSTDINGDGFVEASDYPILNNNSDNFIESMHPY